MDPLDVYQIVEGKLKGISHPAYKFDYTSDGAKAIRGALGGISKAYAVGGKEDARHIFRRKYKNDWWSLLLPHDKQHDAKKREAGCEDGEQNENDDESSTGSSTSSSVSSSSVRSNITVPSLQEILLMRTIFSNQEVPVESLLELATDAPFGKGNKTVIDKEVRNAFEIKADQLPEKLFPHDSPNGFWNNHKSITARIEKAMKRNDDAKWIYKLYKMHIYGPGGFFHPHVDTLHGPNHVATVVVGLPTKYEGGKLVVKHHGEVSSFDLSNDNPQKVTYCAFYTDCTHEVQQVTSGYRIVLQYDVYEEAYKEKASSKISEVLTVWGRGCYYTRLPDESYHNKGDSVCDEFHKAAEIAVRDYHSELPNGDSVALLLQHRYSLPSLDSKILKGSDALVHKIFASSGRWKCTLKGVIVGNRSDIDWCWNGPLCISPIAMSDFGFRDTASEVARETTGKTHVVFYTNKPKPPGQLMKSVEYLEYTGNEAQPAEMVYFACCLVLSPMLEQSVDNVVVTTSTATTY